MQFSLIGLIGFIVWIVDRSSEQANVTASPQKMNVVLEVAQAVKLRNLLQVQRL